MPQDSVLKGRLEGFRSAELLQVMGLNASTGALHLHAEDGRTGLVYVEDGSIVSCSELDTEALTLGNVLQQLNMATSEQIEHAYQLQTQDPLGKRIGERLIDLNILTHDQLALALKTQALWTLREMALWREGSYEFHPDERASAISGALRLSTTQAVMEMMRYESEWNDLAEQLPDGTRTHLVLAPMPPPQHPLQFPTSVWRIIAQVNIQHSVRRIATAVRQPEEQVAHQLATLVRDQLLLPVGTTAAPGLPDEAERLSMNHFNLFALVQRMEQDWIKKKSPVDQLVALATFINLTMLALEEACRSQNLGFAPDTLSILLARERLTGIDGYEFKIDRNRIDIDDFAAFCKRSFDVNMRSHLQVGPEFYHLAQETLLLALGTAFEAINARIASPRVRSQNKEVWDALFATFRGQALAEE
ncbi:MAG TPA: DUF4388 domain-containing protein [Ktedonobacterales bacterium]